MDIDHKTEKEEQLDTRALVELLQKDAEIMRPEEIDKISLHFRSKIEEAGSLREIQEQCSPSIRRCGRFWTIGNGLNSRCFSGAAKRRKSH